MERRAGIFLFSIVRAVSCRFRAPGASAYASDPSLRSPDGQAKAIVGADVPVLLQFREFQLIGAVSCCFVVQAPPLPFSDLHCDIQVASEDDSSFGRPASSFFILLSFNSVKLTVSGGSGGPGTSTTAAAAASAPGCSL